ncbi:methionyl-tRNA formyltransferase [Halobacteriovorax sp. GFR7]|uniref:methionyl-tRNA formyltransferase n=1 Tax=unclassified Halobacteriovorax TaxID=2639665 RepID=UPI003D95E18A
MKKLKAVFFGTPDFSCPSLELLANHPQIDLKLVISMPDRPAGRGQKLQSPPVITYCKDNKIKFYQTENINKDEELLKLLDEVDADFYLVLAFAQFLGSKVLNKPKLGCFNIHTSLLPKYRGAAPIQYALLNGDTETGVSIQKMVKKMDAGDIVKESNLQIAFEETGGQLYTRLKFAASLTLNDFITDMLNDEVTSYEQDESKVSFAPTLKKEDGHLKFLESDFNTIHNQVRALKPWPGTYCFLNEKRLKVIEISKYDNAGLKPGEVKVADNKILVGCTDSTIRLDMIQLEGKKACRDTDAVNGLTNKFDSFKIS